MRNQTIISKNEKKEKTILQHVANTWKTHKNDVLALSFMSLAFTLSFGSAAPNLFIGFCASIFITLVVAGTAFISFFLDHFK